MYTVPGRGCKSQRKEAQCNPSSAALLVSQQHRSTSPLHSQHCFQPIAAMVLSRRVSHQSDDDHKDHDEHSPSPSSTRKEEIDDSDQTSIENGTASDETKEEVEEDKKDGKIGGRSKAQVAIIMLALCLAVFLAAIDATIITTALPTISEHFNSSAGYTWIGSAYLLANAASTPIWAKTSDIFGRKPMLLAANIVFIVGSLIAALSKNIAMLIVARVIQGLGAGGLICLVNVVIGDLFPLRVRGGFYGLVGATWAIASSLGPILGGVLTQKASWRWCFWINLPIDGVAFVLLVFFLNLQTPRTPILDGLKAIDWLGTLLVVGATVMFLLGLQEGGVSAPWDSAKVLCLIIFGIFTFALFLTWQWRGAKYPIMPLVSCPLSRNLDSTPRHWHALCRPSSTRSPTAPRFAWYSYMRSHSLRAHTIFHYTSKQCAAPPRSCQECISFQRLSSSVSVLCLRALSSARLDNTSQPFGLDWS
ncbi:Efflux pump dotC [Fulvia fulva]|uniref:Efflux pump dotC n=1 Tax=Passalora fulva TaxID=5499 RepID=A0A9Q8PEA9_PASFU|nr:Efflux pump dotC [Fulvia fulva]KAK4617519.1 Efflux pump dotC [Fulvia fulva]KAK4619104.1 Efflux pump dotC [Fulvia fulva]UJO20931.1 Efflux pump dotC [Fulvia fulva]WPV18179.1 Efflux pump dotC [Fulvia fulva]WPV33465.1 Efflux pump dotC [Fulvia fulva]